MKLCPQCQANVEGLIGHCDCCGASLDTRTYMFSCGVHDVPECLGFSSLAFQLTEELEPEDTARFADFLEKVVIELFCYPEAMVIDNNIKNDVYYSAAKKFARVTAVVSYWDFVFADQDKKAGLVARAIHQGIHSLQARLCKKNVSIAEITANADRVLKKYVK